MKKYEIFALWGNLSNASTFKYEVLKVIKSSEFSFATGNMMIKSTLEIPAAIQLKINNICARWMNASVLARIRSLAPNAHALRSCSFVRSSARSYSDLHASRSVVGRPSCPKDAFRKTRARRPRRKSISRALPSTSSAGCQENRSTTLGVYSSHVSSRLARCFPTSARN